MEKLSLKSYVSKCVLGSEIAYVGCFAYAYVLTGALREAMFGFFNFIPGYSIGGMTGFIAGGVSIGVMSTVFGSYMVWMHNSSVVKES